MQHSMFRLPRVAGLALGAALMLSPAFTSAQVPVPHEGGVAHRGPSHRSPGQHGAVAPGDLKLPNAPARLWVIATDPQGPWTMRVDNHGEIPLRIPADSRLLSLEVTPPGGKTTKCRAPKRMRATTFPESRALVLEPGHSYVEVFDPRMLCFGKDGAALRGGAQVKARYGWDTGPAWARKGDKAPFVAAGIDYPATHKSLKNLTAPTIRLSYARPGPPPKPEPIFKEPGNAKLDPKAALVASRKMEPAAKKGETEGADAAVEPADEQAKGQKKPAHTDANRPRLEVDVSRFADASSQSTIAVTVKAINDGRRDMLAALRPRMVSFEVVGPLLEDVQRPDPRTECPIKEARYAAPREMFKRYKPNESVSFRLLVAELCPKTTFLRPGLYQVRPVMHATETGEPIGLKAFTATKRSIHESLVRVQTGRLPFHKFLPAAIETSRLDGGAPKSGTLPRGDAIPVPDKDKRPDELKRENRGPSDGGTAQVGAVKSKDKY